MGRFFFWGQDRFLPGSYSGCGSLISINFETPKTRYFQLPKKWVLSYVFQVDVLST